MCLLFYFFILFPFVLILIQRFLQNLGYPRQYIQLHRDSTVPSLIARPSLSLSRVVYEDTPLILAIKHGHVLVYSIFLFLHCIYVLFFQVVDEADKAQLEVVCVLKGIIDGELSLPDGRFIRSIPPDFHSNKVIKFISIVISGSLF